MLVISSREFREKQAEYMDRADNGEQIIVQRGKNKAYAITPVTDDDLYFTPAMLNRIKQSIEQVRDGKEITVKTNNELKDFLDSL
ncbi:prevent-host-death family protein [Arcticibacter tournemirensis]|uniref:Type II toxin-antitoxin system prevent-host-death family antitoxin n=1 Tax=Arcticibacter tournemirensis TaxID=699437 RepID=A0A4Q0MEM2_9SPHI|nr:type II toxin-antitoxin system prevent-host-death family antitoxin [Arcticibacter tournemirensis]KAA8479115.1 type II toxin-antitoxin system prevent-host-death family antitoxin [Arcticibacter tournemirensis]RXF71887.1 type II toxin-antitoxin system prevent-host-death family antitoxin [Arcticibacter tournemirensis]TQM48631.1 prevent-host-death family protein [Arcticibacter tournemirensis]